jgi:hypothetical protein
LRASGAQTHECMSSQPTQTTNGTALAAMGHERGLPTHGCPPHAWGCPVVMKLDPRSVAWTCAGCGAIVTVPDGGPPPDSAAP